MEALFNGFMFGLGLVAVICIFVVIFALLSVILGRDQ